MRTRVGTMREEQGRIARVEAAEAIAGGSENPDSILRVVPSTDAERLAAEALVIAD